MSNLYWLSEAQMERLKPFLPKSHWQAPCRRPARPERHNLRQSQWFAVVRRTQGVRAGEDPLQSLEALERERSLRPDHDGPGGREGRAQDDHDRRDLAEGASHGFQPVREKGGRARQIGRSSKIRKQSGGLFP